LEGTTPIVITITGAPRTHADDLVYLRFTRRDRDDIESRAPYFARIFWLRALCFKRLGGSAGRASKIELSRKMR
jgi:hypothetical protein